MFTSVYVMCPSYGAGCLPINITRLELEPHRRYVAELLGRPLGNIISVVIPLQNGFRNYNKQTSYLPESHILESFGQRGTSLAQYPAHYNWPGYLPSPLPE